MLARNALLALNKFVEAQAIVIRDGKEVIISDQEVVPGDVIVLQAGEKVPADARLINSKNLKIDESALTGESKAVHKLHRRLYNPNLTAQERKNMVFKGTGIALGEGLAVVVATGEETVIGNIARKVAGIDTEIPLKANIRNLSRIFIIITIFVSVLVFILGLIYGYSVTDMFATAVSVAVSAIPSGLPVAFTIILASGVWRMSKRNALVKRLQAVEALGQTRVIAVDKTGTLTKNEMMIQTVFIDSKTYEISGVGYEPKGVVREEGKIIEPQNHPEIMHIGRLAALSADGRVMYSQDKKEYRVSGDPTEASMFVFASKLNFSKDDLERELPLISEIPFNYRSRYHATLHQEKRFNTLTVVGAPESVLELCTKIYSGDKSKKISKKKLEELTAMVSTLSKKGLRVLAVAEDRRKKTEELSKDVIKSLSFVGFFGLRDALRPEVVEATRVTLEAGLKLVMITGDHKYTAQAIAEEANIYKDGDKILTGALIEDMSDKELREQLDGTSVFARVTPEHKLRIINAYKANGDIIAMTGDGVNDAPPLVAADLGVAMGKAGTEVAKEASDIILLDDNFASIVSAIEEGRGIYKTIKKVVLYLVSTSIGEILVIVGALLLGMPLPLLAAQIIWLNFVADGFFIPALAMESRENNLLKTKFLKPDKYLIDKSMVKRMLLMTTTMTVFSLIIFNLFYEADIARAMTIVLCLLAVFQWFNAWNCRSETVSIFDISFKNNLYMLGATLVAFAFQLLAVYHPFFQSFLHTVPLEITDWIVIFTLSFSIIAVEEARKNFSRRREVAIA